MYIINQLLKKDFYDPVSVIIVIRSNLLQNNAVYNMSTCEQYLYKHTELKTYMSICITTTRGHVLRQHITSVTSHQHRNTHNLQSDHSQHNKSTQSLVARFPF